jgi:hypothetical protein
LVLPPVNEFMLKAALLPGEVGQAAWEQWLARADIDRLDYSSFRLVPLLYHNLLQNGIDHELLGRFKGIYRRAWYQNQILFHKSAAVFEHLHSLGTAALLLKGAAWATLFYPNAGLRPMRDLDVLIPFAEAERTLAGLTKLGWRATETPHIPLSRSMLQIAHARALSHPHGLEVDLHWHVLHTGLEADADTDFWHAARPLHWSGVDTRTLHPGDHFLHICALGAEWDDWLPVRWVADAVLCLRAQPAFDWDRFCAQVERHRLALQMQNTLPYLQHEFAAPIPDSVIERIGRLRATATDHRLFAGGQQAPAVKSVGFKIWYYSWCYERLTRGQSLWQKLIGWPKFFQEIWGLPSWWRVPVYAVATTIARLRRIAQRQRSVS